MTQQPIIDIETSKIIMNELLCRPKRLSITEYFNVLDPDELWQRELTCIKEGISLTSNVPKNININLSSLPYFLEFTNLKWNGGLEIVEWGPNRREIIEQLPNYIEQLKARGLQVWVDDLDPAMWDTWKDINVTGFKIKFNDVQNIEFLRKVQSSHKPLLIEQIETNEQKQFLHKYGLRFAQGYLFDQILFNLV